MGSKVEEYIEQLPSERKSAMEEVRKTILENIPKGYEEVMQYGMISFVVPISIFPNTYNNQPLAMVSLGNQKNHMTLYMNNIYSDSGLKE